MPLSKAVVKSETVPQKVLDYVPPKFEFGTPEQTAVYFEQRKNAGSTFRMNEAIRVQTGVADIESEDFEKAVDRKAMERLKEVQENAYQEAYMLGLDEGKRDALQSANQEIQNRLAEIDALIKSISNLKKELLLNNEAHIIKLVFQVAKRIAYAEINAHPEVITSVIRQALEKAQVEENVTVQISPDQYEFLENLKKEAGREFEFLNKVKLEPIDGITPGGCVIHTNYGEIDAQVDGRVELLWEGIKDSLHKVKDTVGG
jgi:flagellar assembly protein FliH